MKFSVPIALLFFATLAVAQEDYIYAANYLESCYEKLGFTDRGKGTLTVQQTKCGLACMFTAFKLMNEDGSVNHDEVLKHSKTLTKEKLNEYVQKCEQEGGFDAKSKEYACEIAACFQKNDYFSV